MSRRLFDQATAQGKLGQRIQTLKAFSGVPAGTLGRVTRMDPAGSEPGFTLGIQWELQGRATPLTDWFTRDEYEGSLRER